MSLYDRDNPQHLQYLAHWRTISDDYDKANPKPKDEKSENLRKEEPDAK